MIDLSLFGPFETFPNPRQTFVDMTAPRLKAGGPKPTSPLFFKTDWQGNYALARKLTALTGLLSTDGLRKVEQAMGRKAQEIAHVTTPVLTGSWASSWAVLEDEDGTFLGIPPTAVNPFSDEDPPEYAPKVQAKKGISWSGHDREVTKVLAEKYTDEITKAGGDYVDVTLSWK